MSDSRVTRLAPLFILVLGALLYLPRLGSNGLWDPTEVRVADAARAIIEHRPQPHIAVNAQFVAAGFKLLGVGELGGRLPLALLSILLLLAAYWAGRAILRPRAALLGAIALATMPAVLFGARQLTTQVSLLLGVTLAVGGLVHLAWPLPTAGMVSRVIALVLALAGLALGTATAGLLHGAIAPLLGVLIALIATRGGRSRAIIVGVLTLGASAVAAMAMRKRGVYSEWLAGIPRVPQYQTVLTTVLRPLGFATTPWFALAPFALLHAFDGTQPAIESNPKSHDVERDRFARLLLPAWLAAAYMLGTLHDAVIGELLAPAAPALALLAGAYLDMLLDGGLAADFGGALEGVAIGSLVIVLGHDVLLTTEAYISVLCSETVRWPTPLNWTADVLFGFIAAFGVLLAGALLLPTVWPKKGDPRVAPLAHKLLLGAIAVPVLFSFALAQWFIPAASKHLSPKDLYGKTRQLDPKAPLAQYRFNATGSSYYMNGRTATQLNNNDELSAFLHKPERVFVFVGSDELAAIDQAARGTGKPAAAPIIAPPSDATPSVAPPTVAPPTPHALDYVVVDDSNSRFLILSNRLGPGESDLNPLRRFVSTTPPKPQFPQVVNFEDKLRLIGYDLPGEVDRGADVKVRLYFEVLAPVGGSYKVFLHFDGPGARVNGDHVPLDGKFATQFWTPGTYVTDEYLLKPDRATEPSGAFQLFFGLFSGDKRMKVKEGASDGENRVKLGMVHVR